MRVLICGGGVIGASTAYFLARRGVKSVVIERTALACAASGKSGGFLAHDWCDGTPLEALARRSFMLHAQLADEIADEWGYRRLETFAATVGEMRQQSARASDLQWVADDVSIKRRLGSAATTAQVHPGQFTAAMMRAAQENGAELRFGHVTGLVRDAGCVAVRGVAIESEIIAGDAVVIAMGPWSAIAANWLGLAGVSGQKGHSLVYETRESLPPHALFLEYRDATGIVHEPEVLPRVDGTVYVCGSSNNDALPNDPAEVSPDPGAIQCLEAMCARMLPSFRASDVIARQACYRPMTPDGLPLLGPVSGINGVYMATGHGSWGILNAPATGEALAEWIIDGTSHTLDLSRFDPGRFRPESEPRRESSTKSGAA